VHRAAVAAGLPGQALHVLDDATRIRPAVGNVAGLDKMGLAGVPAAASVDQAGSFERGHVAVPVAVKVADGDDALDATYMMVRVYACGQRASAEEQQEDCWQEG